MKTMKQKGKKEKSRQEGKLEGKGRKRKGV